MLHQGGGSLHGAPDHSLLPKRGRSCKLCKAKKVKCNGALPCDRCWRLSLRCQPQGNGGGDDCCGGQGASGGWGSDTGAESAIPPGLKAVVAKQEEDEEREEPQALTTAPTAAGLSVLPLLPFSPSSGAAWPPPPGVLMGMIVQRTDPRALARLLCHSFVSKHRQGLVLRDNAVRLLYVTPISYRDLI